MIKQFGESIEHLEVTHAIKMKYECHASKGRNIAVKEQAILRQTAEKSIF